MSELKKIATRDGFGEEILKLGLENPEILQRMVHETGAHSTDLQSPESVEHLCGKCAEYAKNWDERAQELWNK